eukprot:m.13233 g.13233  ORF g.13233 m.13233 type:complete len:315 (-) comp3021_c0_seq2:57-1001(-)
MAAQSSLTVYLGRLPAPDGDGDSDTPPAVASCRVNLSRSVQTASHVCDACAKQAGMDATLTPLFALFYVSNTGSRHRYEDDTIVASTMGTLPPGHFLFTKGTLRPAEETAILKSSAALDLLFADTEARIECYDMNPTESELTRLDSLNDPEFPTKRQYVEMAQTVEDYAHVKLRECTIVPSGDPTRSVDMCGIRPGLVSIAITFKGAIVTPAASDGDDARAESVCLDFRRIRRWTRSEDRTPLRPGSFGIEYNCKPDVFVWVKLKTDEALLAEYALGAIAPLLMQDLHPKWPAPKKDSGRPGGKKDNVAWLSKW